MRVKVKDSITHLNENFASLYGKVARELYEQIKIANAEKRTCFFCMTRSLSSGIHSAFGSVKAS